MSAAIGKLLPQFDASGRAKPAEKPKTPEFVAKPKEVRREPQPQALPQPQAQPQSQARPQLQAQPQPQPAAAKAQTPPVTAPDDAYQRGYAAGLAEGETKLADERVRAAIRLGQERAKWSEQQVTIVDGFGAACRELETNIASAVARILQPFLADAVRDKAVAALVEQISALTSRSPVPVFRVTGPSDLLGLVKVQLDAAQRTAIEYQPADGIEIRVVADQAVIETQISAWTERLKDACR
jgi:hypothetical protein